MAAKASAIFTRTVNGAAAAVKSTSGTVLLIESIEP
jgi:hypothetical protein